jgi:ATP-dependent Clp protease ATP-binding subunit ClpC
LTSYTEATEHVLRHAQQEAHRLGYPFIQREQLFLGLLSDKRVTRILNALGADLQSTRSAVEAGLLPGLGAPDDLSSIDMLPTAEQVYRHHARTAATLLGHTHVGTEEILLGFLLEQHGLVLEVLTDLGLTKENVITTIKTLDQ